MFEIVKIYRDGTKTHEIQIIPQWNKPTQEELEISKHLTFNIKTYNSIKKDFHVILKPLLDFLNTLSNQDKKELFNMFYQIKCLEIKYKISCVETKNINEISQNNIDFVEFTQNIKKCINEIADIIYKTVSKLNLIEKIREYVKHHIPMPDLSNAGTRHQDNKKTTFYQEDHEDLMVLSILCKLIFPIFGEIIYWFNKSNHLDKTTKEIHSIKILHKVLNKYFAKLSNLIITYISESGLKPQHDENDISVLFKGIDKFRIILYTFSILISKKLVNINLFNQTKNAITYIYSCMMDTIKSQLSTNNVELKIMERFETSNINKEEDLDLLDHETGRTIQRIGSLIFIKKCIDGAINQLILDYHLDRNIINEIVNWYEISDIDPTPLNEFLVSIILSKYLNNGSSIRFTSYYQMYQLVACIQCMLLNTDKEKYHTLIHMLSMKIKNENKITKSPIDYQLKFIGIPNKIINIINDSLIYVINKDIWQKHIHRIIEMIIMKPCLYNTPPILCKILKKDIINETQIQYDEKIIQHLLEFVIDYLNIR